jgi:hypothetical protein
MGLSLVPEQTIPQLIDALEARGWLCGERMPLHYLRNNPSWGRESLFDEPFLWIQLPMDKELQAIWVFYTKTLRQTILHWEVRDWDGHELHASDDWPGLVQAVKRAQLLWRMALDRDVAMD